MGSENCNRCYITQVDVNDPNLKNVDLWDAVRKRAYKNMISGACLSLDAKGESDCLTEYQKMIQVKSENQIDEYGNLL